MIAPSPYRDTFPASGPDRFVATLGELSDEDFLRRTAIGMRRMARNHEADRLDAIADRLAGLRQLINHP
jgi:hypothetical protein